MGSEVVLAVGLGAEVTATVGGTSLIEGLLLSDHSESAVAGRDARAGMGLAAHRGAAGFAARGVAAGSMITVIAETRLPRGRAAGGGQRPALSGRH